MALLLGLLVLLSPVAGAQGRKGKDPVAALQQWVRSLERSRAQPTPQDLGDLGRLCADVLLLHGVVPERGPEVVQALLDVAAARPAGEAFSEDAPVSPGTPAAKAQAEGRESLARLLLAGPELAGVLASDVLARSSEPLERRLAAARTLQGLYLPPTRLALFACGIASERVLRDAAVAALVGWDDDGVHRFLVEQLRRNAREPGWISPRKVREHFSLVRIQLDSPAAAALSAHVREALRSSDWRTAYRAVQLAPGLPDEAVVPELIEALRAWIERRDRGEGRLRLEGDIAAELRRRSGRDIGPYPERWSTWWRSRQAAGGSDAPEPDPAQVTAAGFFGLRPLTDRVVFVLDRSGSMDNAFRGGERTRYEEATEQLMALLEALGPQTRFRVILFSGAPVVWSEGLRPATSANLTLVRAWMRANGPGGATHLQPAVAEAMRLDARGRVDLARLEADTVIVLCDGATAEGAGWVGPLMQGPNEQACLLFHSVQVGSGGDETLERLAAESGGDFVRVRG